MKTKSVVWAIVAIVFVAGVLIVLSTGDGAGGTRNVNAGEVGDLLAKGEVRVLDVRTAGEFEAGHLPGAENIPIDRLSGEVDSFDPATPVLVYCATGVRSRTAVDVLQRAGVETIYHFAAGLVAWTGQLSREPGTSESSPPPTDTPQPAGVPVMYEFFTDW